MRKIRFLYSSFSFYIGLILIISSISCDKSSDDDSPVFQIEDLKADNYPKVDGSTSTEPLQVLIACKLLDIGYAWVYSPLWSYNYRLMPSCESKPDVCKFITERIRHSGTHSAFVNLINKYADIILVARTASTDELDLAESLGVELIEVPVALDALVFINNIKNPVNSLTTKAIQDIYMGKTNNWSDLGGADTKINPYRRDPNSGSQELMEFMVMKDLEMLDLPDMMIQGMMGLINAIEYDPVGLGYSVNYYTQYMIRSDSVKRLTIDGNYPDYNSIKNRDYAYTAKVYAVICKDLKTTSEAYKLYDLLLKASGQDVIKESGYVPYY
jgi:phosphate transport system substrate-binding protein